MVNYVGLLYFFTSIYLVCVFMSGSKNDKLEMHPVLILVNL